MDIAIIILELIIVLAIIAFAVIAVLILVRLLWRCFTHDPVRKEIDEITLAKLKAQWPRHKSTRNAS